MDIEKLAKNHEVDLLLEYKDELIKNSMKYMKEVDLSDIDSPDIWEWFNKSKLDYLIYKLIASVILKRSMTAQGLLGMFFNQVKHMEYADQMFVIDHTLRAVAYNPTISVRRIGMYLTFTCKNKLSQEIIDKQKSMSYILPSIELPLKIVSNMGIGYRTVNESLICGGHLKHHDLPLNLNHINRMNRTPYRVETRLQFMIKPKFNETPKLKDNGEYEDEKDISKRYESWKQLHGELGSKVALLGEQGNRFYIHHKYDNGGRTYAKAHHFNYQGEAYLKAMIQAYEKEYVEPEF